MEEIDRYLFSTPLTSLTPQTTTDPKKLREELGEIRSRPLGYNREEFNDGVFGVAAPAYDRAGNVIAALSIVAPSFRIDEEKISCLENILLESDVAEDVEKIGKLR